MPGACTFFEAPYRRADSACVLWHADANPAVLPLQTRRVCADDDQDALDIRKFAQSVFLLKRDGIEHVLLADGARRIQLEVRGSSLLDGPVHLRYDIAGFERVAPKLVAIQRLLALRQLGRFPRSLFPRETRAHRWLMALRAVDGRSTGANPRAIAAALFGEDVVRTDWNGPSDYLRSRVRRAIAAGERLVNGGYRALLSS